jgi:hypothetical protein
MDSGLSTKLIAMKEKVEQAETKAAQLKGRLDGIYERLKTEFNLKSLEDADKELNRLDAELVEKEKLLADGVASLELEFQKLEVAND